MPSTNRAKGRQAKIPEYDRKRNFSKTPEPSSGEPATGEVGSALFVIQKHAASRLHYDFRLEMEGLLKSWAIPKGIPYEKSEKHLAIQVEDHPYDYARFEGIIPKGEYGGGTVMVWDIGRFRVSGGQPMEALRAGKIHLCLEGKKLRGEWILVRTHLDEARGDDKESWMLIKTGESARAISKHEDDQSAISGRSMSQIAEGKPAAADPTGHHSPGPSEQGKPEKPAQGHKAPRFIPPMKAKLVNSLPEKKGWIYELKFDGYRAIALKNGGKTQLYSRNEKPLFYPAIEEAVSNLPCGTAVFDGEIVALDEEGRPTFQLLQSADTGEIAVWYYLFDLLSLNGLDLRTRPLVERKEMLASLIPQEDSPIRFSAGLQGVPSEILAQIKSRGLEGIVAKRAESRYEAGQRSGNWIKIKCLNEQEFVIGGYTVPKGTRSHFGALLVGYFENGQLRFAGKVGTGFSERMLEGLNQTFSPLQTPNCPFTDLPSKSKGPFSAGLAAAQIKQCHWVKPELACQVKFTEWTRDGKLRQPVFLGLRPDKNAVEVVRERS